LIAHDRKFPHLKGVRRINVLVVAICLFDRAKLSFSAFCVSRILKNSSSAKDNFCGALDVICAHAKGCDGRQIATRMQSQLVYRQRT